MHPAQSELAFEKGSTTEDFILGVSILDCTLRDGSYQLGFRFTPRQTRVIAEGLQLAGVTRIEVGHGVGIGASQKIAPAVVSDEVYGASAAEGAEGSWGMFAIPGIAEVDDLVPLVDKKMKFVRIGVDADEVSTGLDFVERVANKFPDLEIFVNFMKSYVVNPVQFGKTAKLFDQLPITGLYLVDSAGGMTEPAVVDYGTELLSSCEVPFFGFHGHNNLGLAVANSVALERIGFNLFDATLQGLGRSAGNAVLEQLVALFSKLQVPMDHDVDLNQLFRLGEDQVRHLIPKAGVGALDTAAGLFDFHSSHFEELMRSAVEHRVDPLILIKEVANSGRVASSELIHGLAGQLPEAHDDAVLAHLDYYSSADSRTS